MRPVIICLESAAVSVNTIVRVKWKTFILNTKVNFNKESVTCDPNMQKL